MNNKILIIALVLFCSQIVFGAVQKTLTNDADWSDRTKHVFVYNRLRGNVIIDADTSGQQKQATITTSVTAADRAQADSVTVTVGDYVVTINPSVNSPSDGASPSDQLKSSAAKTLMSVSIISLLISIIGGHFSPKSSTSSSIIVAVALVSVFGVSLTSTQADLSQLRADVTIIIPFSSTVNFTVSTFPGRPECSSYLNCNTVPSSYVPAGAQGLMGYWLAEAIYTSGQLVIAYNDSSLCTGPWPGCSNGAFCTANGIKKAAFFSDSIMETRSNAKTSSDFNDRGAFVIAGDLVNYTKTEAWSCAHPKKVANYSSYTVNQIENGKLWMSNIGSNVPADASKISTWTVYHQVSFADFYGKYFIAVCQDCSQFVGCGGTSGTNPVCPCKCYSECQRLSGFGEACPTKKRDVTVA